MTAPLDIAGAPFPGGMYRVDPEQNRSVCRILGTEPSADGTAHPIYAFIATLVGCGLGVDDIVAVANAGIDEGPMLAALDIDYRIPLRVGESYAVSGVFIGIERKQGRRAGVFDLLQYELRLTAADGSVAVVCAQSQVLPRSDAERA